MAPIGKPTVWREGDRIRATDGQGYHDRVTDAEIRGHIPSAGPRAAEHDAFARAVLAIRKYEREALR